MIARDVMTTDVVTVEPGTMVSDIAKLLLERHISAVPVVDSEGRIAGIVSEGDLMHRPESDTEKRRRPWWLAFVTEPPALAQEFAKSHGLHAADVMTRNVIVVDEETPVAEIAEILEENRIKRVPVVRDGVLVGIVSRANLLRGLATRRHAPLAPVSASDQAIQGRLMEALQSEPWANLAYVNATVSEGVVHLWGMVESEEQATAFRVAAEGIPGVKAVEDHLGKSLPIMYWGE